MLVVVAAVVVDLVIELKILLPVKTLAPLKVLLSARRVEEAVLSVPQENFPADQVIFPEVALQVERLAPKKLVVLAVVVKRLVVVAEVEVELRLVKFWRVVEPFTRRLEAVISELEVRAPPVAVVKKRFVELAVVEKKFVEVAEEVVELPATKKPRLAFVE